MASLIRCALSLQSCPVCQYCIIMLLQYIVWSTSLNVFFDGTANDPSFTTNIWKQFDAFIGVQSHYVSKYNNQQVTTLQKYNSKTNDLAIYISGIGTNKGGFQSSKKIGGYGMDSNVRVGYEFLVRNEHMVSAVEFHLNVFGYSRGAATARMLANYVCDYGITEANLKTNIKASILDPSHESIHGDIRPDIDILGIYDTVPSLNRVTLSRVSQYSMATTNPKIKQVYHAVALNEHRFLFNELSIDNPSNRGNRIELSFLGSHGDVGGQRRTKASPYSYYRSQITLEWMNTLMGSQEITQRAADLFDQKRLETTVKNPEYLPIVVSLDLIPLLKKLPKHVRNFHLEKLHPSVLLAMQKFEISTAELTDTSTVAEKINTPENLQHYRDEIIAIDGELPDIPGTSADPAPKDPKKRWDWGTRKGGIDPTPKQGGGGIGDGSDGNLSDGDLSDLEGGDENGGGTKGGNDGKVGNDGQGGIDGNGGSDGKGGNDGKGGKGGMGDFNIPTLDFPSTNVPVDIPIDLSPGSEIPPTYKIPDIPIDGGYTGKPKVEPVNTKPVEGRPI
eukprot:NODE_240_length_11935_cov_0.818773.p1 type:complete len:560 gc:universal NODE_240_length_11935_cov_0.818773:2196-517(-)